MYEQPLISLVLSGILSLLIIKQCINRRKFLKGRLLFSFLLIFLSALVLAFVSDLEKIEFFKKYLYWMLLGYDIFIGILFVIFSELSSSKEQFNRDLFATLDKTKLYVLVDKKNRIKEISSLFLEDLEITSESAINKNFFDTIELKYRIFKLNGTDATKNDLNIFYSDPNTKEAQMNLEIHDDKGDVLAYYFTETPIMLFGKFKGRMFVGSKKGSENLVGMEKNLAESSEELDLIKSRFVTILEKSQDGIFFADLTDKSIWVNDVLTKNLCLNDNKMSLEQFVNNIHPEDLPLYKAKIAQINNVNPQYSLSYRYNVGTRYAYVKEEGTRISNGKIVELCGVIRVMDSYRFEKTQTEIDSIAGEAEMLAEVNKLYKDGKTFQVVGINMPSVPSINQQYGRNVGNMALSEYIKLFKYRFVDANLLFRTSGLQFFAIILDYRKMELLKNNLINGEKILHVSADYGSMKVKIDVNMGICYSSDAKDAKDVINKSLEALRFSNNSQYNSNYAYYKDIR